MKKLVQVHTLPTEDRTNIMSCYDKYPEQRYLQYSKEKGKGYVLDDVIFQHLYFTTDEEIKEGDWYIFENYQIIKSSGEFNTKLKDCRKIVAATDPKLTYHDKTPIGENINGLHKQVPQLQQSFLKEFVANPKVKWEVEYISAGDWSKTEYGRICNICECEEMLDEKCECECGFRLNKTSNNCVITSPVEPKLYSGIDLMGNQDGSLDHFLLHSSKFSQEEREIIMDAICDWIEKTL